MAKTAADDGRARVPIDERLLNLVTLLLFRPRSTLEEIVTSVPGYSPDRKVARREFLRDKSRLAEEGFPVETVTAGRHDGGGHDFGYRILPDRYELPDFGLTDDETAAIRAALATVTVGDDDVFALWKLGGADPVVERPLADLDAPPAVATFHRAALERRVVRFRYGSRHHEIEPYGVAFRQGRWYMAGTPVGGGPRLTFLVARVDAESIETGGPGAFEPPPDFDPSQVMPAQAWEMGDDEPVSVVVEIDDPTARWVEATLPPASVIDRTSTGVIVRLDVSHLPALRTWVLGLGRAARVLEPPAVVADIVGWLEAIADPERASSAANERVPPTPAPSRPARRPKSVRRLHRILAMLAWLAERDEAVPVGELARRFDTSPEQVVADLALASVCGVPPYGPSDLYDVELPDPDEPLDEHALVRLRGDLLRPKRPGALTPNEVVAVATAGRLLLGATSGADRALLQQALDKIERSFGASARLGVIVDTPPHLAALRAAASDRRRIRIEYFTGGTGEISTRSIDPIVVRLDNGRWYVDAFDHKSRRLRSFRVDRILSLEVTDVRFDRPPTVRIRPPKGGTRVVLAGPPTARWVTEYHPAEAEAQEDGSLRITLDVRSDLFFDTLLLQLGAGVRVIEPAEWRERPAAAARQVLERYR